jgi:hypothetical protein
MSGIFYRFTDSHGRQRSGRFVVNKNVPRGGRSIAGPLSVPDTPYSVQTFARPIIQQLMEEARYIIFEDATQQVRDRLKNGIDIWINEIYKDERSKAGLEQLHEKLAAEMHEQIVAAFDESGIGKKRASYRWADTGKLKRFSNKALKNAISDPRLVESDYKGIAINVAALDKAAVQWYKLNFGAGAAGEASPTPNTYGPIKFGKFQTNTDVNLNGYKPSAPFMVPAMGLRGYWTSKSGFAKTNYNKLDSTNKWGFMGPGRGWSQAPRKGQGSLVVLGRGHSPLGFEARLSKGIAAHRFLDAGTQHFNRHYGQRTSKLFNQWHNKARREGRVDVSRTRDINRLNLEIGPL